MALQKKIGLMRPGALGRERRGAGFRKLPTISKRERRARSILGLATDVPISRKMMAERRKREAVTFGLKKTATLTQIQQAKRKTFAKEARRKKKERKGGA